MSTLKRSETESAGVRDPPTSAGSGVATIQIKLRPLWPKDPVLWFAQIESQF